MDKVNTAEWVLQRVMDRAKASEILGDLMETRLRDGDALFWLSICRVVFAFSWRTLAGVAAAVLIGLYFAWAPYAVAWRYLHLYHYLPTPETKFTAMYLEAMSMLPWAEAGFVAMRFGLRDGLTTLSVSVALLGSTIACTWPLPYAQPVLWALTGILLVFYVSTSARRRALGVWSAAMSASWLISYGVLHIRRAPAWTPLLLLVFIPVADARLSLLLHRRLLARIRSIGA